MSTTVLIVEHVIAGVQTALVLVLLAWGWAGWQFPPVNVSDSMALLLAMCILAVVYPLGVLIDEIADQLLHSTEQKIRSDVFAKNGVPSDTRLFNLLAETEIEFTHRYFDYLRMRIRITRSTILNSILLLFTIITLYLGGHFQKASFGWMAWPFFGITLTILIGSIWTWSQLANTFAKRIAWMAKAKN